MISQIIGWFCLIFAALICIGSISAALRLNDPLNSNVLICATALFLIAAAICFK